MSSSTVDEQKDFFKVLNNHIARKTTATGINYFDILKILGHTKKFVSNAFTFTAEKCDAEQREALSVNLNWFFNQLLYFALNDSNKM